MTSEELTAWWAFYHVLADESEHSRHLAESGDGQVFVSGRDDEIEEPDGDPE